MIVHLCCKIEWSFKSYKSYSSNKLSSTSSRNEKISFSRNSRQNSEIDSLRETNILMNKGKEIEIYTEEKIEKKKKKKKLFKHIQAFAILKL